jgi:hypothetical protein
VLTVQRAGEAPAEICDYFQRVLDEHLLPSGRVRYFGMSDYTGDWSDEHVFASRVSGEVSTVRARRKVVDATYLEPTIPSTHTPSFQVDSGVRLIPVNDLVALTEPGSGYTVIGAGKTATYPDAASGWLAVTSFAQRTQALWFAQPDLISWLERSRLNAGRGLGDHAADPRVETALARLLANTEPAIDNLERLLAESAQAQAPA